MTDTNTKLLDLKTLETKFDGSNIPESVRLKLGKNLHQKPDHPIGIIKDIVYNYFSSLPNKKFATFDNLSPIVTIEDNFDKLLIPKTHPARSKSDTFYINDKYLLRTHTSAHQNELLSSGYNAFLVTGDVYRKDEIDSTHNNVFTQTEGVFIDTEETMTDLELENDLINVLKGLCSKLFPNCESKVSGDYFPFTNPSFQIHVNYGRWIEILGCGIIQSEIIKNCSNSNASLISKDNNFKKGWAFGLGLDRLAMILFDIPDIRILWVDSEKFTGQFTSGSVTKFKPYSVLDPIGKDISFYIPSDQVLVIDDSKKKSEIENVEKFTEEKTGITRMWSRENDFFQSIRESADKKYPDIISKVVMLSQFYNTKLSKLSRAYRIYFSPPDPNMKNLAELTKLSNELHVNIANDLNKILNLEIR
jgi:phenylalanyl-tRNA synthetase alpha chain